MTTTDYGLSEVPKNARKSLSSLIWVLCGFTFFTATMFAGGGVGSALPLNEVISVTVIGFSLLTAYAVCIGLIAYKTGLSTVLLARYSFGDKGCWIVDFLTGVSQMGWYAWGTATIAKVLIAMMPAAVGVVIPDAALYPMMIFFGFAFSYTAIKGYKGLEILSRISVPLMVLFISVSIYIALGDADIDGGIVGLMPETGNMSWNLAITIAFGTFASGATQVSNWTRFADSKGNVILAVIFAFFFGNTLMFATGALGASVYGSPDVVEVLLLQGFPLFALLMLFLNVWTTQDNGAYNFGVTGCNFFRTADRKKVTFMGAGIATGLALLGIDQFLFTFLALLGTFIPPVGGVLIADYVRRGGKYAKLATAKNPHVSIVGVLAYALGSLCAYFSPFFPPLAGILVAFSTYFVFYPLKK